MVKSINMRIATMNNNSQSKIDGVSDLETSSKVILPKPKESIDMSFDSDDDSSWVEGRDHNIGKLSPHGGVVPHENDIVISLSNEHYKLIITPELERLVDMMEKGLKPDVKRKAEEVMNLLREVLQKQGGSYLQLRKKPTRYEKIDEIHAKKKIEKDLSSESRKMYRSYSAATKTTQSATMDSSANTPTKKRSYDMEASQVKKCRVESESWAVRPRRASQQLRDDMPLKETLENSPNPIGKDVLSYTVNPSFKHKLIQTEDDKAYCIGQMISNELVKAKGHTWAVKHCEVNGKWEFVTFRDCNNLNSRMEDALNDETKDRAFVGYSKLAEFVLQNGMLETLIKNPEEIREMMKKLRMNFPTARNMSCIERVAASFNQPDREVAKQHASTNDINNEAPKPIISYAKKESTAVNFDQSISGNVSVEQSEKKPNTQSTLGVTIKKLKELQHMDGQIRERMANAKSATNSDSEKCESVVAFYTGLRNWLARRCGEQSFIESFNSKEIQSTLKQFEDLLENLAAAEANDDTIGVTLNKNLIQYMIIKFL